MDGIKTKKILNTGPLQGEHKALTTEQPGIPMSHSFLTDDWVITLQ